MDPVVPIERWPRRRGGGSYVVLGRLAAVGLLVLMLVLATVGVDMYTDWLWFGSLGLSSIYATVLTTQVILFLAARAGLFLALYLPSAFLARRLAHRFEHLAPPDEDVLWAYIARVGARIGRAVGLQPDRQRRHRRPRRVAGRHHGRGRLRPVAGPDALPASRCRSGPPIRSSAETSASSSSRCRSCAPLHSWLLGTTMLIATTTFAVYAVVSAYELGVNLERVIFNLPRAVKLPHRRRRRRADAAGRRQPPAGRLRAGLLDAWRRPTAPATPTSAPRCPALYIMAAVARDRRPALDRQSRSSARCRPAMTGLGGLGAGRRRSAGWSSRT